MQYKKEPLLSGSFFDIYLLRFRERRTLEKHFADYFGISEFYRRQFFAVAERSVAYDQITVPRIMFKHGYFGTGKRSVGNQATLAQP